MTYCHLFLMGGTYQRALSISISAESHRERLGSCNLIAGFTAELSVNTCPQQYHYYNYVTLLYSLTDSALVIVLIELFMLKGILCLA